MELASFFGTLFGFTPVLQRVAKKINLFLLYIFIVVVFIVVYYARRHQYTIKNNWKNLD